ncbi:MAG TPA: ATP-binding protein [Xanthobacteraceae bacterium]
MKGRSKAPADHGGGPIAALANRLGITAVRAGVPTLRSRLYVKYVGLFVTVVGLALLADGAFEIWSSYEEQKTSLMRIEHEQAEAAAGKIEQFIGGIEHQLSWTTQLPWSVTTPEQRRFDALRLLRLVPAISDFAQIDPSGHEQLRVSRVAMDVVGSNIDVAKQPEFTEAVAHKVYYGKVYFRRQSEPYMTLSLTGAGASTGVSSAQVNLKLIWDVVSHIKVGDSGRAFVVDADGRLIAHPDISLVLRDTDMSHLPQVRSARGGPTDAAAQAQEATDLEGHRVLTAYAPVAPLGWWVFVETPIEEAYGPLYAASKLTGLVLLGALALAVVAGMFLAGRMVGPIQALRAGAARIGSGDLGQRIVIRTGDEVEALADQFNDMAGRLQESYSDLEQKVEDRTRALAQSVAELRALGEVSQAVNSTLDLETVLATIVAKAVQLSGTEAGAIYGYDTKAKEFRLRATYGMDQELIAALTERHIGLNEPIVAQAIAQSEPVQAADLREDSHSEINDMTLRAGYRARLMAPLRRGDEVVGMLVVRRRAPGEFAKNTIDLIKTFAAQSVLAVQNARLFHEIEEKGRQLEMASRHKSQFLANMSHELRTPLNAILGYTELMLDQIYGEVPAKMHQVLQRVQANGKHLLGLINDVLDLSKIEAGHLVLSLADYSISDIVHSVYAAVEPLASSKELRLEVEMPPNLPRAHGDDRRLMQVLLNLVGNAIKFTDQGEVAIKASAANGSYTVAVHDTGPGISAADQAKIFDEFHQADGSETKSKGGSGLGLSIAKRIVEMHGGRLWVESSPGNGSTFTFTVPLTVNEQVGP